MRHTDADIDFVNCESHTRLTVASFLCRVARGDDLRPVHTRHGHICQEDDVQHHPAGSVLHCVGLRGGHHPDALLPAHTVCQGATARGPQTGGHRQGATDRGPRTGGAGGHGQGTRGGRIDVFGRSDAF